MLDRLVTVLKTFYAAQHPTAEIEAWGRVARLKISTDENFRQTRSYVGKTISPAHFAERIGRALRDRDMPRLLDFYKVLPRLRARQGGELPQQRGSGTRG